MNEFSSTLDYVYADMYVQANWNPVMQSMHAMHVMLCLCFSRMCMHAWMHACIHGMYVCMYVCTHIRMHVCTHACIWHVLCMLHACMCARLHVVRYVYVCACVCVCFCVGDFFFFFCCCVCASVCLLFWICMSRSLKLRCLMCMGHAFAILQ